MKKDYLWLQISSMPYFRGLLRAVEGRFYEEIDLPSPTLDLGCGDGHFASVTFDRKLEVGLDPWTGPLREAERRGCYVQTVQSEGARIPFPDGYFASAISNSVLEHIPDLEPVLAEVARVLRPGAQFAFCVPNHQFDPQLSVARALDRLGLHGVADAYRRFFDRIARHQHLDSPEVWTERLEKAGFEVVRWWHYFSPQALAVLEWGHAFGLPALVARKLTGRWILVARPWNLILTQAITRPHYEAEPEHPLGVCTFYIVRRKS
ncbi:MAG: methyltransferase domain-containing protein [Anaerolinea sp.]|nr:methyltransferase domain-containing protein [Anaerolinea sp.]